MNVADSVRLHARRMPDRPALIEDREVLDWAALQSRIEAAAWQLREAGVVAGDVVAVSLASSIGSSVLGLATLHLGATVCLVDRRSPSGEVARMLAAVGARLLLADRVLPEMIGVDQLRVPPSLWSVPPAAAPPPLVGSPAAPAFLMLSSGSTGQPKAAAISHQAAAWRGFARIDATSMRCGLRVMQVMPVASAAGIACLMSQLMIGATTWFRAPMSAAEGIVETILRERIEQTGMVPTVARAMMELAGGGRPLFPDIEAVMVQSARFHAEEKREAMARLSPALYDGYGSLGTGMIAVAGPVETVESPASVGRAVPFCRIEIVDRAGRPVDGGEGGRIRVRCPGLADGYVGNAGPSEGDEFFLDGWSYPGDLGRLDGNGLLYIEGRAASMIIRGGQTLYPEEIERVLMAHPGVAEAAVIGKPDRRLGEVPVALLVPCGAVTESALRGYCRANLQGSKVPVVFRVVSALPTTDNGKVRRSALAALFEGAEALDV